VYEDDDSLRVVPFRTHWYTKGPLSPVTFDVNCTEPPTFTDADGGYIDTESAGLPNANGVIPANVDEATMKAISKGAEKDFGNAVHQSTSCLDNLKA
jgi:hypothetical protein